MVTVTVVVTVRVRVTVMVVVTVRVTVMVMVTVTVRVMTTYHPTGKRLLVQRLTSVNKIGRIHLSAQAIEKVTEGIVIAVGTEDTKIEPTDHVIFTNYAGKVLTLFNENLIMIEYDEVVAIVQEDGSLKAGAKYTLTSRMSRAEKSTGGLVIVPRRTQEETDAAIVYDPGIKGLREGFKFGDLVAVRQHCGVDFVVAEDNFTAFDIDNDEILGTIEGVDTIEQLDVRSY